MTDDISKVVEARQIIDEFIQCSNVGRWDGKLVNAAKDWLAATDRLESATTPAEVDGDTFDAISAEMREVVKGYDFNRDTDLSEWANRIDALAATLARQLAEANERIRELETYRELTADDVSPVFESRISCAHAYGYLAPAMRKAAKLDEITILRAANIGYASEVANLYGRAGLAESQLAEATRRLGEMEVALKLWRDGEESGDYLTQVAARDARDALLTKEPTK